MAYWLNFPYIAEGAGHTVHDSYGNLYQCHACCHCRWSGSRKGWIRRSGWNDFSFF